MYHLCSRLQVVIRFTFFYTMIYKKSNFLVYFVSISYKFSFFLSGGREVLSGGMACDSLDNVPCSTCAKYLDGLSRPKPLEFEDAKCVWLPEIDGCKTKAFALKKGKEYVEFCSGSIKLFDIQDNVNVKLRCLI